MIHVGHISWDLAPKSRPSTLHVEDISSLQYSITSFDIYDSNNSIYLVGTRSGLLLITQLLPTSFNLPSCHILKYITPPMKERLYHHEITTLKISPCHRYLAVGFINGLVIIFQLNKLENLSILYQYSEHKNTPITALCWSIDSCKLFSGSKNGCLVEFNLIDGNPSIDVVTLAASFFGITKTLQIGDCKSPIISIDYYFSPSDSLLKSTEINPATMLTSFLPYSTNTSSSDTSSSGDNLLVCLADYRVIQFRLFRNGTKQAKMMSLNIFVQRSQANLHINETNGNNETPYVQFSFGCYLSRNSSSLTPRYSQEKSPLIYLFSANSPEIFICDFIENSINKISLRLIDPPPGLSHEPISFMKVFIPKEPSNEYLVLTRCHRIGVINLQMKTFHLFHGVEKVHSFLPTPSTIIYLLDIDGTNSRFMCALTRLSPSSHQHHILPRTIHVSFSRLKQKWKMSRQRDEAPLSLSMPSSPSKSPGKPGRENSSLTFHSIELLLQQNLNECDLLLERINLDVLDAMHMPTLSEIENSTDRRSLLPAFSPSIRSPTNNYDHSKISSSDSPNSKRMSHSSLSNDVSSSPEVLSYASLSYDQSSQLLSLSDHFEVITLSKKMFFRDFIQLLDSHACNSEDQSLFPCRYGEHMKLLRDKANDKSDLQCLYEEVDELCLLSGLLTKTIEEGTYDLHCKYLQPNQRLLVKDNEIFQSFRSKPSSLQYTSIEQLDQEVQQLLRKSTLILAEDTAISSSSCDVESKEEFTNFPSPLRGFQPSDEIMNSAITFQPETEISCLEDLPPFESEFATDPDWIRNTNETWLDQWLDCPPNSSLYEMKINLHKRRGTRDVETHQVVFEEYDQELPMVRDTYQVTLKSTPYGLGLSLNLNQESILVVTGFTPMPLGITNPARTCRMIAKGDMLIKINELSLLDFDQNETIEVLKSFLATKTNEHITLTFRYFDALCGNIKFSPSKVSIEDTVWRDTKEDENLTTFQEVDELIEPIDPAIDESETEVEIDNQSLPHHQKRKENPLFDFFSGLSTDVLTRSSSAGEDLLQVEEMSMLDVASALFSGSIDEIAFQSVKNKKVLINTSELLEKEIISSHLYPTSCVRHCISPQIDHSRQLEMIVDDIWKSSRISHPSPCHSKDKTLLQKLFLRSTMNVRGSRKLLEDVEKELHHSFLSHQREDYEQWMELREKSERNIGSSKYDLLDHQALPSEPLSRKSTLEDDESLHSMSLLEYNQIIFHDRNYQLSRPLMQYQIASIPSSPIISKQGPRLISPSLSYFSNPSFLLKNNLIQPNHGKLFGSQTKAIIPPPIPDRKETHQLYELIVKMFTQSVSPLHSLPFYKEILKHWISTWIPNKINSPMRKSDKLLHSSTERSQISLLVTLYFLLSTSPMDLISTTALPHHPQEEDAFIFIPTAQFCFRKPSLFHILQLDFSPFGLFGLCSDETSSPSYSSSFSTTSTLWSYDEIRNFYELYDPYLDDDVFLIVCSRLQFPKLMIHCLHSLYTNPLNGKSLATNVPIAHNTHSPALSPLSFHEILYKFPKLIQLEPTLTFSIFSSLSRYFSPWILYALLVQHERFQKKNKTMMVMNGNWYSFLTLSFDDNEEQEEQEEERDTKPPNSQTYTLLSLESNEFYLCLLIEVYEQLRVTPSKSYRPLYPIWVRILELSSYLCQQLMTLSTSESVSRAGFYATLISRLLDPQDDVCWIIAREYSVQIFSILFHFHLFDLYFDLMANLLEAMGLSLDLEKKFTPKSLSKEDHLLLSNYATLLTDVSSYLFPVSFSSQNTPHSPLRINCECLLRLSYVIHLALLSSSEIISWRLVTSLLHLQDEENSLWKEFIKEILLSSLGSHAEPSLAWR